METTETLIRWLDSGDVSIRYQFHRDLLDQNRPDLQAEIQAKGWGVRLLAAQREDGHWGRGFYMPKWTSTHYTLLDLRHLNLAQDHPAPRRAIGRILKEQLGSDGGVNPSRTIEQSDICINGMFLHYACYFQTPEDALHSIVDYLVSVQMADGGFNCNSNRFGAVHSSLHTTLSVLEGLLTYRQRGYTYRLNELKAIEEASREFILQHRLYRSDRTGKVINKRFLMLSFPPRWFYDILRALDYFQAAGVAYDERMADALEVLLKKRRSDGTWPVQAKHAGQVHFDMEVTGKPSRWNTLRALRVLRHFGEGD